MFGGIARRSESGHDGGWKLRLVGVANSGAADRSIGSDSARAAAPGSVAGLPRFSDHADVHRCERPALCGQRRSGWAAAHSCANQCPGCGARPRLGFAARGRCGPSRETRQGSRVAPWDSRRGRALDCAQGTTPAGHLARRGAGGGRDTSWRMRMAAVTCPPPVTSGHIYSRARLRAPKSPRP